MGNLLSIVVVIFIFFWAWNNLISPPKFIGFYYPNADNLLVYKQSPELSSLEQCRNWIDDISGGRTDTSFDYECGKNCKLSESGGIYVCDETLEQFDKFLKCQQDQRRAKQKVLYVLQDCDIEITSEKEGGYTTKQCHVPKKEEAVIFPATDSIERYCKQIK